jgi:hypothetical protein
MVVRFGMPPSDIRPGFHAAMRSAGNRLPDGAGGGGAGASCARWLAFDPAHDPLEVPVTATLDAVAELQRLVVGSEATAVPLTAPQMIMRASLQRQPPIPIERSRIIAASPLSIGDWFSANESFHQGVKPGSRQGRGTGMPLPPPASGRHARQNTIAAKARPAPGQRRRPLRVRTPIRGHVAQIANRILMLIN